MRTKLNVESRQLCLLPMEKVPAPPPECIEELLGLFAKLVLTAARNNCSTGGSDDEQAHG